MDTVIHGGDIYQNKVKLDFSVNINPLGMPKSVEQALLEAVSMCEQYPDILARELTGKIAKKSGQPEGVIALGNGASELFLAIVHGLKPKKILIPVPSFYGYKKASESIEADICYVEMKEENQFGLTEDILNYLTEDIDLLFLANPNNPVGNVIEASLLEKIAERCKKTGCYMVIDECFLEFTKETGFFEQTKKERFPNVIVVRAFTKIYAIPGVRLGYLFCGTEEVCEKIKKQLPEWNLSCFAQKAGCAAMEEKEYVAETVRAVETERSFLVSELQKIGIEVWPSVTNFLLLKSDYLLYEKLLQKEILIRDCSNYPGLKKGFYRIAVKRHEENEILIKEIGEIYEADRVCNAAGH